MLRRWMAELVDGGGHIALPCHVRADFDLALPRSPCRLIRQHYPHPCACTCACTMCATRSNTDRRGNIEDVFGLEIPRRPRGPPPPGAGGRGGAGARAHRVREGLLLLLGCVGGGAWNLGGGDGRAQRGAFTAAQLLQGSAWGRARTTTLRSVTVAVGHRRTARDVRSLAHGAVVPAAADVTSR